jgi:Peptidase family M28/PA domain
MHLFVPLRRSFDFLEHFFHMSIKYLLAAALVCNISTYTIAQQGGQGAPPAPAEKPKIPKANYTLPDATPYAESIKVEDLQALLRVLTSDSLQGRETGEVGQRKAAQFIAGQFRQAGIPAAADRKGTYFQPILLENDSWNDIGLKVGDTEYKNRQDFFTLHSDIQSTPKLAFKEVVFVGYGIEDGTYSDYGSTNVKGKVVIMYASEPTDKNGYSVFTKSEKRSEWSVNWRKKAELAQKKGAALVLIVDPNFTDNLKKYRREIATYGFKCVSNSTSTKPAAIANTVFITDAVANAIFGKKAEKITAALETLSTGKSVKPMAIKAKGEMRLDKETKRLEGSNVMAVIEGSDPKLKNEYVFITAHYDHLGMSDSSRIFYGADDNGSGTSAVIEIARAFHEAKKAGVGPKRTVVCMLVSGEEKGLLGSQFYVEFPVFPLDRTVVDINIDMVGRLDPEHPNGDYVYVIGSDRLSSELHEINERANATYTQLKLEYKYNDPNDPNHYYERSDHYNFAERGIPAIFYFNGTHADYHKTTDTFEKINFEALQKRAKLAFYTAWDIANRPDAIKVDKADRKSFKK